jgi:hypothetical protein
MKKPKSYRLGAYTLEMLEELKKQNKEKTETEIIEEAITKLYMEAIKNEKSKPE